MTEHPFVLSYSCGTHLLALVHSDLCDFPVMSYHQKWYVIIFVDEFSGFAAIYPVSAKSDTFHISWEYKVWAEALFNGCLLHLCLDCGGEFRMNETLHSHILVVLKSKFLLLILLNKMVEPKDFIALWLRKRKQCDTLLAYHLTCGRLR